MIVLLEISLLLVFNPIAAWVVGKRGVERLWIMCGLALLSIVALGIVVSRLYSVPSTWRVIEYIFVLFGPSLLGTSSFLSFGAASGGWVSRLLVAFAGGIIGLFLGLVLVVYAFSAQ